MASIRKRGDSWQVQVRKQGHLPQTRTFIIKAHAQAWARKVESEIERRLISPTFRRTSEITLGELIARYVTVVTARKRSHIQEKNRLTKLSRLPLSKIAAANITPHDIGKLRDERLMEVGSQAVRHDLNALSQVFTVAIREWDLGLFVNPVQGVWKPPISDARERRLSLLEAEALNDQLERCDKNFGDLVCLALETGMRKGEILRIHGHDLNLPNTTLVIPFTKNGTSRIIPLSKVATEILQRRREKLEDALFPYDEPWCRYHWRKLLAGTGLTDLHFHDLRHEAISRFFEMGLSVPEVALISGHKDYRMLSRYTHLRAEDVVRKLVANAAHLAKTGADDQDVANGNVVPPRHA